MKQIKILCYFVCTISVCSLNISAQQTNTLYFLENSSLRHKLNPAFQPVSDFYISLPLIGYSTFNVGNNSLSLKDIVYNENGNTVTFLNQASSIDRFYNKLKLNTVLRANLQTNLLGFGFHYKSAFWTFSLTEKMNGTLSVPKDVFQLSLYGTRDIDINNSFNFTTLQTDFTAYSEAAFGYAQDITEKWSIGGKFKLLLGHANLSNTNRNVTFDASLSNWDFKGNGIVNYSSPVELVLGTNLQSLTYTIPPNRFDWIKPSGWGVGIDFGVEYKLNENINLSAAILDLGFIRWKKNALNLEYSVDYNFVGIAQINSNTSLATYNDVFNQLIYGNLLIDSIESAFEGSATSDVTNIAYSTGTAAKLNLGFEYNFDHFIGLGILSHTQFYDRTVTGEITTSVNLRPYDWLNAALSYSLVNGTLSTFGAGLSLSAGNVNWFVTADYIPFQKVTFPLTDIDTDFPNWNIPVPYNSRVFNFSVGLNFIFDYPTYGQKYRRANTIEKNTGLKNAYKPRESDLERKYLKSGKKHFLNSKKGLQPTKTNEDCRCDTN